MWWPRAPRDRHHGYVRRFVLVLLSLHRSAQRACAIELSEGEILVPNRPVHRRWGTRYLAPNLLALLTKMMRDIGLVKNSEPVERLFTQGMVIKDGAKMSKNKGNVVSPDDMVARYGADATRLYSLFAAPPDRDLDWQEQGVEGCFRFLGRVYRFVTKH